MRLRSRPWLEPRKGLGMRSRGVPKIQAKASGRLCKGTDVIRVKKFFCRVKSLSDFSCWVFFSFSSVLLCYAYLLTVTDLRLCFFPLCPSIHQSSSSSCETEPGGGKKKKAVSFYTAEGAARGAQNR